MVADGKRLKLTGSGLFVHRYYGIIIKPSKHTLNQPFLPVFVQNCTSIIQIFNKYSNEDIIRLIIGPA